MKILLALLIITPLPLTAMMRFSGSIHSPSAHARGFASKAKLRRQQTLVFQVRRIELETQLAQLEEKRQSNERTVADLSKQMKYCILNGCPSKMACKETHTRNDYPYSLREDQTCSHEYMRCAQTTLELQIKIRALTQQIQRRL